MYIRKMPKLFRNEISLHRVIDMYVAQKMPVEEIAKEFSTSETTVNNALRLSGIPKRAKERYTVFDDAGNVQQAIDMYVNQKKSLEKIGKVFSVSKGHVWGVLKSVGVKFRSSIPVSKIPEVTQKEICRFYIRNGSGMSVARKFKLSHVHIYNILRWNGMTPFWSIMGKEVYFGLKNGKSEQDIAQFLGIRVMDVQRWKRKLGLRGN